ATPASLPETTPGPGATPATASSLAGLFGEELYRYLFELSLQGEEALQAAVAALSAEQIASFQAYVLQLGEQEEGVAERSNAPILPLFPLEEQAASKSRLQAPSLLNRSENPLKLQKSALALDDHGGVQLTLEAYTTGTVKTTPVPADIVLVLDQSGSMQHALEGTAQQVQSVQMDTGRTYYIKADLLFIGQVILDLSYNNGSWSYRHPWGFRIPGIYPALSGQSTSGSRYQFYSDANCTVPVFPSLPTGTVHYIRNGSSDGQYQYLHLVPNADGTEWYIPGSTTQVYPTTQWQTNTLFYTGIKTRQYALLDSVRNFIGAMKTKADAADAPQYRIAVVTFSANASGGSVVRLLTGGGGNADAFADVETSAQDLASVLETMAIPEGGTYPDAGLSRAQAIFAANGGFYDAHTSHTRHVILFTDGQPSSADSYIGAIEIANRIKTAGSYPAAIRTIGLVSGSSASLTEWNDWSGNFDYDSTSGPSGNSPISVLLHAVSSNYKSAEAKTGDIWLSSRDVKVKLGNDRATGCYIPVGSSADLINAFNEFLTSLEGGLEDSRVQDVISPYFQLPSTITKDNISGHVNLYTQAYRGPDASPVWGERQQVDPANSGLTVSLSDDRRTIDVAGYDFPAVGLGANDVPQGNKLIIEFTIERAEGFVGGNDVPTNASATVYDSQDNKVLDFTDEPVANVSIQYAFDPVNRSIYLGNSVTVPDLYSAPAITPDDAWKYDYVNTPSFAVSPTDLSPDTDTAYTVTATIKPNTDGADAAASAGGAINDPAGVQTTRQATVYVYQPTFTSSPVSIYLTNTANLNDRLALSGWERAGSAAGAPPSLDASTKPGLKSAAFGASGVAIGNPEAYRPALDTDSQAVQVQSVTLDNDKVILHSPPGTILPSFTVYVGKPAVTCKDGEMFLGDTAFNWETHFNTFADPVWNLPAGAPALDETNEPTLKYAISLPATPPADADGTGFLPILGGSYDFHIKVAVDQPEGADDIWLTEGTQVGITNPKPVQGEPRHHFTVNVKTGTIVIRKTGGAAGDSYLFTIARTDGSHSALPDNIEALYAKSFRDAVQAGPDGSGEITITGLPSGVYTVTEDTGWSWRYEVGSGGWEDGGEISAQKDTITCNIANTRSILNWLSSECYAINKWMLPPQ
ncbi:MAG TPA: vWA domain-containing protein, partial [Feifaniaceae bacterium]|nr:vWA domain-containing protein [Feifaniaceae bacterium]